MKLADILAPNIGIVESQNQWNLKQRVRISDSHSTFHRWHMHLSLLPVLDINKVKQTEICTQGLCRWARQVFRSSKLINHWLYDQILVEMIQADRTVHCEKNISITLGIRTASSEEGTRQCACYNKGKKPIVIISCAQTLRTRLPWQLNFVPWHLIFGDPPQGTIYASTEVQVRSAFFWDLT